MSLSTSIGDRVRAAAAALSERLDADGCEVALILGSGLSAIADGMQSSRQAAYATLPGFPLIPPSLRPPSPRPRWRGIRGGW